MKPWISAYLRRFHNRAECTLVPTDAMRCNLVALGCRNVRVVARGVDTELFNPSRRNAALRRSWGVSDTGLAVVHVGRLAAEKNLSALVEAFEAVRLVQPGSRLILVGDGPERVRLQASHPEHVYAGMRTGEDLAAHYASGDLFLYPSLTETFGNVTLEAMSSGLTVVAFGYAAAGEYIRKGRNGFLVPVDDEGCFTLIAMEAVRSRPRLAEIGKRARTTAEQLSWEKVLDSMDDVLRALVVARHRGAVNV
jgi:glycosyltransferase involved in cell wall biosynthesis